MLHLPLLQTRDIRNIRKPPMKRLLKFFYRVFLLLLIVHYMCVAVTLPLITCIVHIFSPRLAIRVGSFFAYWAWSIFSCIFRTTVSISLPDKLKPFENYLVISNHIGSFDFMIMNELAIPMGMLSNLKYLIKDTAIYIPVFGIGMKMTGFLYIKRNIEKDEKRITNYCSFMRRMNIPLWLIVYPEGTRFSKEKRAKSQEFCRKRNLPVLNNVLFPRTGGFRLLAENFRGSQIKNVADLTIFFDAPGGKVPSLLDFLVGRAEGSARVNIEVTALEDITDFDEFVINAFVKKDRMIEQWKSESPHRYAHGCNTGSGS